MSAREPECTSFIFLSGVGKTYSGQIRAHVLKRHLKKRKENSLVPKLQNKNRASSSSRIESGSCELAKIASKEPNQETSQSKVGGAPDTLFQADLCRASPRKKCSSGPGTCRLCSAVGCPSPAIVLREHRKEPRVFREPKASKSLWPDLTERQAYLYHHCMSSWNRLESKQTNKCES
jgi:hypothetical protein